MKQHKTILIVDDDLAHLNMLDTILSSWKHMPIKAISGENAILQCQSIPEQPDFALIDMRMQGMNGLETMREIKKIWSDLPVIIMTGYSDVTDAVEAMRTGAFDYLPKPLDLPRLKSLLQTNSMPDGIKEPTPRDDRASLGKSPLMLKIAEMIQAVAPTEATVLITGASGTGKEVLARAIHSQSGRKGSFVGINCGAFSSQLLESELFGYEKGAFTGAEKAKSGLFAEAKNGTLFLDEVGEMPLNMQVKLLRVLQEREYLPVGSQKPIPFTGRILAATNRILEAEVAAGRFREDLFYRLNVVHINLPALHERKEDIPWLANKFAASFARRDRKDCAGISEETMNFLCAYQWPGNIRELANVMERAIILMAGNYITPKLLPETILKNNPPPAAKSLSPKDNQKRPDCQNNFTPVTLQEMEREFIMKTLEACGQNKTEAAKILGISRKTLHSKLQTYLDKQ